ncbi:MAG: hypothetical protein RLZZ546_2909 [Bacteroidota bacterium]
MGGEIELKNFLYRSVKYPAPSRMNGIQGKSIAEFVINIDGKITDVRVLRGLSFDIKNEVERLLNAMPDWIPGENNGKKVKVTFTVPIDFRLE